MNQKSGEIGNFMAMCRWDDVMVPVGLGLGLYRVKVKDHGPIYIYCK